MEKFWSDDFDMDLLKIYPNIVEALGACAEIPLWTFGHDTHGRINLPCLWNGVGCVFFFEKPNLPRDKHGWFNYHGLVSNEKEIECTFLEVLRDNWSHNYRWGIDGGSFIFPSPPYHDFESIMYHIRGWSQSYNINRHHAAGWKWAMETKRLFVREVERYRLGKEDNPYFAPNSVPGCGCPEIKRKPMDAAFVGK